MKYIEIAGGVSVRIDEIECILANDDQMTCTVNTTNNSYQSTFPYEVLIKLIEQPDDEDKKEQEELNILKQIGVYAG